MPLFDEVIIDFASDVGAVAAFAVVGDLGTAEESVGGRDIELIVAVGQRGTVTSGAAGACLFVLSR